jgi:Protein of unknown function (DUF1761)
MQPAAGTEYVRTAVIGLRKPREQGIVSADGTEGEGMRVNWGAIALAGVADWVFGAVWFTSFKAPWQAGTRISPEELKAYTDHPNAWPYVISLLCSILIGYFIARLLGGSQSHGLIRGIRVGGLVGLAAALAMVTEMAFEMRAVSFIMISAAYPLLGCILMGIILGVWKPKAKPEFVGEASAS